MLQASCNSVDEAGSSPLHLAAWAGHGELVRVLLETGPSVPNVNLTNGDKETSLHCAAQVTNQNTAADHVTTSSPLIGCSVRAPGGGAAAAGGRGGPQHQEQPRGDRAGPRGAVREEGHRHPAAGDPPGDGRQGGASKHDILHIFK